MKVLITGKYSFVGNYVGPYLENKDHQVEYISLKDNRWLEKNFSIYDVILHVAGIAHVSYKSKDRNLYDEINHQLTKKVALKAKKEGVKQFIFLSSMIVYHPKEPKITEKTQPNPKGPYALSKLNAENALEELRSDDFNIAILRPSMIYGPGNKGNIPRLIKLMNKIRLFPRFNNQRSFLFVGNLAEAIQQVMTNKFSGIFHLADEKSISTTKLVETIGNHLNKKVNFTRLFNPFIYLVRPWFTTFQKLFGNYYYDSALIKHSFDYHHYPLNEAIKMTLKGESHG